MPVTSFDYSIVNWHVSMSRAPREALRVSAISNSALTQPSIVSNDKIKLRLFFYEEESNRLSARKLPVGSVVGLNASIREVDNDDPLFVVGTFVLNETDPNAPFYEAIVNTETEEVAAAIAGAETREISVSIQLSNAAGELATQRKTVAYFVATLIRDAYTNGGNPASAMDFQLYERKSVSFTAEANHAYGVAGNTGTQLLVTLPSTPTEGTVVELVDMDGTWSEAGFNPLKVQAAQPIEGALNTPHGPFICAVSNSVLRFVYSNNPLVGWRVFGNTQAPHAGTQPIISFFTQVGETMTVSDYGAWVNNSTSFMLSWYRCSDSSRSDAVRVGTDNTYLNTVDDVGKFIFVVFRAENAQGTGGCWISDLSPEIQTSIDLLTGLAHYWKLDDPDQASLLPTMTDSVGLCHMPSFIPVSSYGGLTGFGTAAYATGTYFAYESLGGTAFASYLGSGSVCGWYAFHNWGGVPPANTGTILQTNTWNLYVDHVSSNVHFVITNNFGTPAEVIGGAANLFDGNWHHICGSFDGTAMGSYPLVLRIDGVLAAYAYLDNSFAFQPAGWISSICEIGHPDGMWRGGFGLGEIAFYGSRALSADTCAAIYNGGVGAPLIPQT